MDRQIIVDKNDNVIGLKKRNEITREDIYRVSVLWITNSKDQVLIAQRELNKSHNPGLWEPTVAGTVDEGESYEENVLKETWEEIGLRLTSKDIKTGPKLFLDKDPKWRFFCQIFLYKSDKTISEFVIQKDEVKDLRWVDKIALDNMMKTDRGKFVANFDTILLNLNYKVS